MNPAVATLTPKTRAKMAILKKNTVEFASNSVSQTERLGVRLGQLLSGSELICLKGDLGTGKTAFARGIARGWGSSVRVTSPTFTLINEYPRVGDGEILYHCDCYRLSGLEVLETTGLQDLLDREELLMIEWPERIAQWLPSERLEIEIMFINNTRRMLRFSAFGGHAEGLINVFKRQAFGA